jgi:F-type H+-transporting ATPase subunit a
MRKHISVIILGLIAVLAIAAPALASEAENEVMFMDAIVSPHLVPHFVSYALLGSILMISLSLAIRGAMALVPRGTQNIVEVVAEAMLNLSNETIGDHWGPKFFPLIGTIFMYIMVCNFMGLIPGFTSPTANINMTAAMALPVFFATHYYGLRIHGLGYIKHFLGPLPLLAPLMLVVESLSHLARPVTLAVRLFGNMTAKHQLLLVLGILAPAVVPTAVLGLGVLVSVVQAFVFALLTTLYLAGAVEEAH